jgi:hypothetical protein
MTVCVLTLAQRLVIEVGVDVGIEVGVDVGIEVGTDVGDEVGIEVGGRDHRQAILLHPGAKEDNETRSFQANPLAVNTNSEREGYVTEWADKDLQTCLFLSLNLVDDASDKKSSNTRREDEDALLLKLGIECFDLFIRYGINNKLHKYHPPILTNRWIEDGTCATVLMHFPSGGLGGNVLKRHVTIPIPRFKYVSNCWSAVECGTGLNLSTDVVPYNLEPYDNDFDAKCGGKTLGTNKHISLDHYFLELQTLFMDI